MTHPSYFEIESTDSAKTAEFFTAIFGWSFTAMDDQGNGWFDTGAGRVGLHPGDAPAVVPYFAVGDIDAAVVKVREAGGEASDPTPEQPGFGRFSNCRTPDGAAFGLHQS